jgi:hypothetical protein
VEELAARQFADLQDTARVIVTSLRRPTSNLQIRSCQYRIWADADEMRM